MERERERERDYEKLRAGRGGDAKEDVGGAGGVRNYEGAV